VQSEFIKESIKHLQDSELYKALDTLRSASKSEGLTKDLLSCFYFSYHLLFLMAKHQSQDSEKYERLRNFCLFKLRKENVEYNVFLDLYLFFEANFRTFQRFVWFDKRGLQEKLLIQAKSVESASKEAEFYELLFFNKYDECVNLLLAEDFDDDFIHSFLSKQTVFTNKEEKIEKLRLLEKKYSPAESNYFLFIDLYVECDEYDKLYELFNKFPSLKDPNKAMYVTYGGICLKLEKYNEALTFFESQNDNSLKHLKIAECYEATGNTKQAISFYKKSMKHFRSGIWKTAPDALIRLEAFDELDDALNDEGGKWHQYNQGLGKYYQGLVLYFKKQYKESIKQLDDAVSLLEAGSQKKPNDWYYYQALNNYEITLSWLERAYNQLIEAQDYNMESHSGLNYSNYFSYHSFQENMTQLNLNTNHEYEEERNKLEEKIWKQYALYGQEIYKQAKKEKFPLSNERELFYLSFFETKRETNKKVKILKAKVNANPNNALSHQELGRALLKSGEYQVAEKHFKRAIKLSDRYFVDLHGVSELSLIDLKLKMGETSLAGNNRLFESSMRNYIAHNSYKKNGQTFFMDNVLYKYHSFSLNTISSLSNQYLFFSESQRFNDPFDVNPHLINSLFDELSVDENLFKSFSLAQAKDNLLMWAHYAEEHCGICIGYKFEYLPSHIGKGEIAYKDTLLKENEAFKAIEEYWLTKGKDWEYEREVRLLHFGEDNLIPYCFDRQDAALDKKIVLNITEIIVGLNFKNTNQSILRTLINDIEEKQGQKIKIFKASKDNQHPLKLTIKEYFL
jgi:tetratricopeptide (TPR) repeat protein